MSFSKSDLVHTVAEESNQTKAQAERMVDLVLDTIAARVAQGDKVSLYGFGTFAVKERAERNGRHPQTGEPIRIAASRRLTFRPSKGVIA